MNAETVVVVGAGHAAGEFAFALRSSGYVGEIILLGEEVHRPYQRPALSKGFLTGEVLVEQLYLRSEAHFEKARIQFMPMSRVTSIDRAGKSVIRIDGRSFAYSKLVLATGGRPRRLGFIDESVGIASNIHYLRTIEDGSAMRRHFNPAMRLVIIGGGYIGLEVAATASQKGVSVTLLEADARVLSRVTAPVVSEFYTALHRAAGVTIRVNSAVKGVVFKDDGCVRGVECQDGSIVAADFALVGIGLIPNTELAQVAGLEVDNGIVVDEFGQTSDPDILAIGDCSSHWNIHGRRRMRLESVPSTVDQARSAAAFLMGKSTASAAAPWFWSDQYNIKLQIVGVNHGYDAVFVRGSPTTQSFLVFYVNSGVLIAVDVVNRARDFQVCKKLVTARVTVTASQIEDESYPLATFLHTVPPAVPVLAF